MRDYKTINRAAYSQAAIPSRFSKGECFAMGLLAGVVLVAVMLSGADIMPAQEVVNVDLILKQTDQ